jgi:[acyl-carrier-protein] S-malonyltransferase
MKSWAALFPGQGSQHPGMGHFLFENFKEARMRFEEAGDILRINFKKLCFEGPAEDLQMTANTQPALLLVSVVTFEVIRTLTGFKPSAAAGHSIGEYAALVTADALTFQEALPAVRTRGEAMQDAVPAGEGGMCAVLGLSDSQTDELCTWVENESGEKPLSAANFNSPGQIVISGKMTAINWLQTNFKKEVLKDPPARARFIPLKVSAPFHCAMMRPAEEKMRTVLSALKFKDTSYPIVQNFTATEVQVAKDLRENLIRQISAPVLWAQCMQKLSEHGATHYIEFGSGKVLSGLAKKIDAEKMPTFNVTTLEELNTLVDALKT